MARLLHGGSTGIFLVGLESLFNRWKQPVNRFRHDAFPRPA
jgi:hypothetical protein